ncbi:inositol phosphate kinase 1 isoform X2 [Andrena cerasifolii]|uniref:inositol phosphate kinase 1 isoform X2 n=1 Tax=Andrena cerasifolii TaxID=2819439 RepID=UPI004037B39B
MNVNQKHGRLGILNTEGRGETMRISEGNPVESTACSSESMTTSTGNSGDDSMAIPEPPLPLTTFSVEDCVYRGEGNANVVIALSQECKVIRFRKSVPDDVPPDGGKQRAEREVKFVRSLASCFLGPYTQIPEILRYDAKDIARLSEAIHALRPDTRRYKEITETYATKFPDYTFLRTKCDPSLFRSKAAFCVEIKPKQGYLRDTDPKLQKCPYCLTQYYKLKKKIITERSTYCPFDLFSGVEGRMKLALKGLLKSPQNNLKIFKEGIVVYDHESSLSDLECVLADWFHNSVASTSKYYIDEFCNLICAALLYPFAQEKFKPSTAYELYASARQDFVSTPYINTELVAKAKKLLYFSGEVCNLKGETLPNNSVLERILHMQRLPFISSEYVYNIYLKFRQFLVDDTIYYNLLKTHECYDQWISTYKYTKTLAGSTKVFRETHLKKCITEVSSSKKSKHDDDHNGNKDVNSGTAWFRNNGLTESVPHRPKSTLCPILLEDNNSSHNKFNLIYKGHNVHCNEQETNGLISTESILCLQNYLLFSCARDCSILIAFRELNLDIPSSGLNEGVIKLADGLSFLCNIGISDLDPKSLRCIEKHRQRDTDVLNYVISVLEEELTVKNHSLLQK